jgi:hypothetical protein
MIVLGIIKVINLTITFMRILHYRGINTYTHISRGREEAKERKIPWESIDYFK